MNPTRLWSKILKGMVYVTLVVLIITVMLLLSGDKKRLMARAVGSTNVGYFHSTPPPWPNGNCLTVVESSKWWDPYLARLLGRRQIHWGGPVLNMHAENFNAALTNFGLRSVQVERLEDGGCLVVDQRIPRAWLLESPCSHCNSLAARQRLLSQRPECFRENPMRRFLLRGTWKVVDREDVKGMLAKYLPGDRVQFGSEELKCLTAGGELLAQRTWELSEAGPANYLLVYEMAPPGYKALSLEVARDGDTLTLTPRAILASDGGSSSTSQRYESQNERLRLEPDHPE